MGSVRHPYEFPFLDVAWSRGGDPSAGIFLLEGRCHIAAYDSSAARALAARGALHVAGVRFDADPLERSHRGRSVQALTPADLLRRLEAGGGWARGDDRFLNTRESEES